VIIKQPIDFRSGSYPDWNRRVDFAKGHPANQMTYEEEADKFRGCAGFAKWPSAKTESLI